MSKVIVIQLSSLVEVKHKRSIDAFARLGISKFSMLWHSLPLPKWLQGGNLLTSIDRFRIGDITFGEFRKEVNALFSTAISSQQFAQAWNAQCEVTAKTKEAFKQIKIFEKAGYTVYVISGTNPSHISHIEHQYGQPIPGKHIFSYEKGFLGKDLIEDFIENTLRIDHSDLEDEDILWLAKQAEDPHPNLGKFGWLVSGVQKIFFHKSQQEYANLVQLEREKGLFTLIRQSQTDRPLLQSVLSKLQESDEEKDAVFAQSDKTVLHQQSLHKRKSKESKTLVKFAKPESAARAAPKAK